MGLDGNEHEWGLRLSPEGGAAVRAGVAEWLGEARETRSAAERLRRIRATRNAQAAPEVRAWQARPKAPARARAWALAGLAALLALAVLAYALVRSPGEPLPRVAEHPPELPAVAPAPETPASKAPVEVAATVVEAPRGLFVREPGMPAGAWRAAAKGEAFAPGTFVQLAEQAAPAVLSLAGHEGLTLTPGTLVRLGDDHAKPAVDVWRGGIEVQTYNRPLSIGTVAENAARRRELAVVPPNKRFKVDTARLKAPTLDVNGTVLLDERALKPVAFTAAEVVEGVRIQPGTANLLNVIDGGFANVSVAEIAQALQDLLNVRVRLSPGAQKTVGAKAVTLNLGQVTGAEALAALADMTGLTVQIREGDVVLELPDEKPVPDAPPADEQF